MDTSSDREDDDAVPSMGHNNQSTSYQHKLLYVVQKCWHSGPKQHVPVDMLRLFHSQRDAEQGAYHSALAFLKTNNAKANSTGSSSSVKTVLLPSYPAHNPQGSSYGFMACGALFWVRALRMTIVAATAANNNTTNNSHQSSVCHSAAYAILTEGVIGGTGNRNSRRGTETCDGRVFGGDATARAMAMEAVSRVQYNLTNPSLTVQVQTVPVGKPAEWLSTGAFGGDWPVHADLWTSHSSSNNNSNVPFGATPKRQNCFGQAANNSGWGNSVSMVDEEFSSSSDSTAIAEPGSLIGSSNSNESFLVVDCPFEEPIAKRRRIVSVTDDMMMQ